MKYAILHDYGSNGHQFYTDDDGDRKLFDTFGEAYIKAVAIGYTAPFEIVGIIPKENITVSVCERK